MGAATIAAALAGRPASRWYALLLAAAATLALDPRAAADPGWQLSFAAVVGIALLAAPLRERLRACRLPRPVAEAVAVTLAATLATAPLIAVHFDRVSLVALPANVLATPAVAPIMWLGGRSGAGPARAGARRRAGRRSPATAARLPRVGLARSAPPALPAAQRQTRPSRRSWCAARCRVARGRARALARRAARGAAASRPRASAARRPASRRRLARAHPTARAAPPPDGALRVTALDIGQGDATLLQAGGHAILVDAGPAGAGIVGKLKVAGIRRLDALVVTHPQADHDGGAPAVLAALPVACSSTAAAATARRLHRASMAPAQRARTRVTAAQAGQIVRAGPLTLRILWPPAGPATPGDRSQRPRGRRRRRGLRRDRAADRRCRVAVLAPLDLPPVDVLKVSHHGSADPGLPALLAAPAPRVALIEVGADNTYGHPTPATLRPSRPRCRSSSAPTVTAQSASTSAPVARR